MNGGAQLHHACHVKAPADTDGAALVLDRCLMLTQSKACSGLSECQHTNGPSSLLCRDPIIVLSIYASNFVRG
jgi:hypothetical protein